MDAPRTPGPPVSLSCPQREPRVPRAPCESGVLEAALTRLVRPCLSRCRLRPHPGGELPAALAVVAHQSLE